MTLAGLGVREGTAVRLPDSGGQWATNFDVPALDVQSVGADPRAVREALEVTTAEVVHTLTRLQADVPRRQRITWRLEPPEPSVVRRGGATPAALLVLVVLGAGLGATLVGLVDLRHRPSPAGRRGHGAGTGSPVSSQTLPDQTLPGESDQAVAGP